MGILLDKELPPWREDEASESTPGGAPPIRSPFNPAAPLTPLPTGLVNPAAAGADARERAPASSEGSRLSSAFGKLEGDYHLSDAALGDDEIIACHRNPAAILYVSYRVYRLLVAAGLRQIIAGDVIKVCSHAGEARLN